MKYEVVEAMTITMTVKCTVIPVTMTEICEAKTTVARREKK